MNLSVLSFAVFLVAGPVIEVRDQENAFQSLKEAIESKQDAAQVKKLAAETCALAREVISAPAPESDTETEAWPTLVAHARDIELYTEYALSAAAVQPPPTATVDLLATLERQNPKSKYLAEAYGDRKSTRLNSSHSDRSRMPSSA